MLLLVYLVLLVKVVWLCWYKLLFCRCQWPLLAEHPLRAPFAPSVGGSYWTGSVGFKVMEMLRMLRSWMRASSAFSQFAFKWASQPSTALACQAGSFPVLYLFFLRVYVCPKIERNTGFLKNSIRWRSCSLAMAFSWRLQVTFFTLYL